MYKQDVLLICQCGVSMCGFSLESPAPLCFRHWWLKGSVKPAQEWVWAANAIWKTPCCFVCHRCSLPPLWQEQNTLAACFSQ